MQYRVMRLAVGTFSKTGEEAEAREAEQGARRAVEEDMEEVFVQAAIPKDAARDQKRDVIPPMPMWTRTLRHDLQFSQVPLFGFISSFNYYFETGPQGVFVYV
jgi:hypothetical protein